MPLINCYECQNDVSDKAYDCPFCSAPLRKPTRSTIGQIFKWTFILFNCFIAWWLLSFLGSISSTTSGVGLSIVILGVIWFVGASVTGLLAYVTRAKKV